VAHTCPTAALPSGTPLTDHVTLSSVESITVGVKDCRCPGPSVAEPGAMITVTPPVIVTVAAALDALPPITVLAVAWIVTGLVAGESAGAV